MVQSEVTAALNMGDRRRKTSNRRRILDNVRESDDDGCRRIVL
jgi:hypothetical protein